MEPKYRAVPWLSAMGIKGFRQLKVRCAGAAGGEQINVCSLVRGDD